MTAKKVECALCHNEFDYDAIKRPNAKYCSKECMRMHRSEEMRGSVVQDPRPFISCISIPMALLILTTLVIIGIGFFSLKSVIDGILLSFFVALWIFSIPAVWVTFLVMWVVNKLTKV